MKNLNLMRLIAINHLENTKLVTGGRALLADVTVILVSFTAAATALVIIYNLFRLKFADENDKPKYKKGWKTALISGVGILVAEGGIAAIFAYFM